MLDRFLQFIKKHALFNPEDKLLVAVSGGVDSVVLCHLLQEAGYTFSIAHCNFKLRGEASDKDEQFVIELGKSLSVPCYSTFFQTRDEAKSRGISTQMAARELRYNWFSELKKAHGYNLLVTAHHKNDIAETILLNLTRGTSINGIAGIPMSQNGIVRPFLSFTKSELLGYALNHKVKWREDPSNKSVNYKRNKIRHEVVPILQEINPTFLKQAERFAEKNKVVKTIFSKHLKNLQDQLFEHKEELFQISKSKLLALEVSPFELEELLIPYGFNYDQCVSILEGLEGLVGTVYESTNHHLYLERDVLQVKERHSQEKEPFTITEGTKVLELNGRYQVSIEECAGLALDTDSKNAMLDAGKLTFPLLARPWRQGDRFKPLGMQGEKLVSDFLIDQKTPLSQKNEVFVLEAAGQIAWVMGHRVSEDFKVNEKTQSVLYIKRQLADKSHP